MYNHVCDIIYVCVVQPSLRGMTGDAARVVYPSLCVMGRAPRVVYPSLCGMTGDAAPVVYPSLCNMGCAPRVVYPSLCGMTDDATRVIYSSLRDPRGVFIMAVFDHQVSHKVPKVKLSQLFFALPKQWYNG